MVAPSQSLATLRPELGTLMEFDLAKNQMGFIGYRILPIFNADLAAGTFGRIPKEQLGKLANVGRNAAGGYNRQKFTFKPDSYATQEYGLEGVVDVNQARMYARYFDAELATSRITLNKVLTQAEVRVANAVFDTGTWTGASLTTSVPTPWSTLSGLTAVADVRAASQQVRDNCGQYANALIINRKVFRNLQDNEAILDRITSSGAGSPAKSADVTTAMLQQVFDIAQVIVADSSYDNAIEGQPTTFTDIWSSSYAMVCILASDGMGIEEPSIGRTLHWAEDGSKPGGLVESYYEENVRGNIIRVRHQVQEKVIYKETGHLLSNIT